MSDYEDDEYDGIEAGLTSVLLGFSSKNATQADLSVLGNHIGGSPVWFRNTPPSGKFTQCKVCGKQTDLLCQLSCPLPDKYYDRSLYVFSCSDPNCRRKEGSVIAIRGVESNDEVKARIKAEESESADLNVGPPESSLGNSMFDSQLNAAAPSENPFAASSISTAPAPSANSAKPKKKKNKKKEKVSGKYPCKLLEVDSEFLEPQNSDELMKGVKIEEEERETGGGAGSSSEPTDLKALEASTDAAFMHFVEIVECNPEQVLRYERGLKPLLYSLSDGVPEKLKNLQSHTLEVQLMPHLILELETPEMIADGMEWGTIYVATDNEDRLPELDANGVGYVEEWVAVQWEEQRM